MDSDSSNGMMGAGIDDSDSLVSDKALQLCERICKKMIVFKKM